MQRVDPFIPVSPTQNAPARPRIHRARLARPVKQLDFVHPRQTAPAQPSRPETAYYHATAPRSAPQQPPVAVQPVKKSVLKKTLLSVLRGSLLLVLFALGFLIRYALVGQIALALYALLAIILRIESRTTFTLALLAFGVVLIGSVRSDMVLAQTFGIYAFLLLAIGTLTLGREVRDEI